MNNFSSRDNRRFCPDCGSTGRLYFEDLPESVRAFPRDNTGVEVEKHMGATRDYLCTNCDCEFTLNVWSEGE